jgi:hypothetical protein
MKMVAKITQQGEQQYRHSITHRVALSKSDSGSYDVLFDRKVDLATAGLRASLSKSLKYETSHENALVICNYIISIQTEINLSDNYRMTTISLLAELSKFHNQKLYKDITRESILTFLDNLRKPEGFDPLHKWIGTYNTYRMQLLRFFKWYTIPIYSPANDRHQLF